MPHVLIVPVLQRVDFLKSEFVFLVLVLWFLSFLFNTTFLIQCFYYCMGLNVRNEIIVIAYNLNMYHNIIYIYIYCKTFPCIARVSDQLLLLLCQNILLVSQVCYVSIFDLSNQISSEHYQSFYEISLVSMVMWLIEQ